MVVSLRCSLHPVFFRLVEAEGIDYTEQEHFVRPECIFHNVCARNKGTQLKLS